MPTNPRLRSRYPARRYMGATAGPYTWADTLTPAIKNTSQWVLWPSIVAALQPYVGGTRSALPSVNPAAATQVPLLIQALQQTGLSASVWQKLTAGQQNMMKLAGIPLNPPAAGTTAPAGATNSWWSQASTPAKAVVVGGGLGAGALLLLAMRSGSL